MKSKYLRDIGCEYDYYDDERKEQFDKEKEEYGIASYETWNLDLSFVEFLYISFKMYDEYNCVDTHYHKLEIDGEEWDMQKAIDYIISTTETYLKQRQENYVVYDELSDKFYEVLKTVMPLMWW